MSNKYDKDVRETNRTGVEKLFPELTQPHGWWPCIPHDEAVYYVLFRNNIPLAFVGVVYEGKHDAHLKGGLKSSQSNPSPFAMFELISWLGYKLMDYNVKTYVINDAVAWQYQKIGFIITRKKKMKYWTAYWMERKAVYNGKTEN